MARVTAAQATRSPRNFGKTTPSLTAFTWWLARPMRCMPLATDGGASIWMTRSMAPMSIPSSSDEVATSAGIRPRLQRVLDLDALLARQRAVVRPRDRFARQLVERAGQPLREAPAVREEQRAPVSANQVEQARMDARPDRRRGGTLRGRPARDLHPAWPASPGPRPAPRPSAPAASAAARRRRRPAGTRWLARRRRTRRAARPDAFRCAPWGFRCGRRGVRTFACLLLDRSAQEPRDLVERPLRGGQADALEGSRADGLQPLERQRQMRAALGGHQRVDLVDDDRLDRAKHLAGPRREQEVERLGSRDEDVGRLAQEPRALGGRRVARADRDGGRREATRPASARDWRCRRSATAGSARRPPRAPSAATRRGRGTARSARAAVENITRLIAHRKAASVFPLPVGDRISVDSPRAIAGQPSACGVVGSPNEAANQCATAGWNRLERGRTGHGGSL